MSAAPEPTLDLARGVDEVKGYEPQTDRRSWAVTTLLNYVGDSFGLIGWSGNRAGEDAVKFEDTWKSIEESSGTEEAIKWIAAARWRAPKGERTAAKLGEAVHQACEIYARTGEKPSVDPEVQPFLDRFDEWLQVWQPRYLASEFTVYSTRYGYAGTGDAILELLDPIHNEWIRLLIDYKTTKESLDKRGRPRTPYPETALQLAAYRYADLAAIARVRRFEDHGRRYYLLNEWEKANAVPMPNVTGGAVVHITPDACDLFPVRCDEEIFDTFLACVDVARFFLQTSQTVLGAPLVKP